MATSIPTIAIGDEIVTLNEGAKDFGVMWDNDPSLSQQLTMIVKATDFQLYCLSHIRQ